MLLFSSRELDEKISVCCPADTSACVLILPLSSFSLFGSTWNYFHREHVKPLRDELDIWNAECMAALTLHISAGKKKKKITPWIRVRFWPRVLSGCDRTWKSCLTSALPRHEHFIVNFMRMQAAAKEHTEFELESVSVLRQRFLFFHAGFIVLSEMLR